MSILHCTAYSVSMKVEFTCSKELHTIIIFFFNEQKVGMLLQKRIDTRGVSSKYG